MGIRTLRRKSDDSGSVLVESAFVLPIVVLLVFGVIEFGMFWASASSTSQTARQASRFASANYGVAADKDVAADEIRDVVVADIGALTGLADPIELLIYRAGRERRTRRRPPELLDRLLPLRLGRLDLRERLRKWVVDGGCLQLR